MHTLRFVLLILVTLVTPSLCAEVDPVDLVNPFIGTGTHGHTHPAATVPHGMVQPGPDTRWRGWDACSGYAYADTTVNGFAYNRLSGTGCADFGDFLVMPMPARSLPSAFALTPPEGQQMPWASPFSHEREQASPGYYALQLDRYGVLAEMTATERAAIHRFTYAAGDEPAVLFDLDYAIQEQVTLDADAHVVDSVTLALTRRSYWWAYDQRACLYVKFSRPFRAVVWRDTLRADGRNVPRCKVMLRFPGRCGGTLLMRAGMSAVDTLGARRNLEAEIPHFRFDDIRRAARRRWHETLSCIRLDEPAPRRADEAWADRHVIFYTALYHAALAPIIFSDVDGRYRGMDLAVHHLPAGETEYTVFSLWDTFRALHPLISLLRPERNEAYIRSLLRKGRDGGLVPKWDCAGNYTACMPGYHFASLAADAAAKGDTAFSRSEALVALRRLAEADDSRLSPTVPLYKRRDLLPPARKVKNERPFIPCDADVETVAKALEYAYDDWCIARLARSIDSIETARRYERLSEAFRHYFDPVTGFMRGRTADGAFRTPFDPYGSHHRADDYCEGTAWQWTWFVPHRPEALVRLMGGRRRFVARLDSLFIAPSQLNGPLVSADISGMVGQYAHGNEPSHHIAYLYNYAGAPHRTQELCDTILRTLYTTTPEGLAGNEDCGQMSAWYILSSLGLYQVCPGRPEWTLGRPLFDRAEVCLPRSRRLVILTHGNGPRACHVRRVTLNGRRLRRPFVSHSALMQGGTLEFWMEE